MSLDVHYSSSSDEYATPQDLWRRLNSEFQFTVDVAAARWNKKCRRYFSAASDGLKQDWGFNRCWCNPPYSQLKLWLKKADESAQKGALVVMLIPARTDTKAFHAYLWDAEKHCPRPGIELRFVPGRLKFNNTVNSAPFPSLIAIFRPRNKSTRNVLFTQG